jgi:hypothetical protein
VKKWAEGISEGALVGPPPTMAHHGGVARPGGLCPPGAPPSGIICTSNSQKFRKNHIKFSGQSKNFDFSATFLLHGKNRKQTKHGILFYLTNNNKKLKIITESCVY